MKDRKTDSPKGRKLKLKTETLRILDDKELERIAGGASAVCNDCTDEDNATACIPDY